jgi:hypothetical protein
MELQKALVIANKIVDDLTPHCEIINVAGSCRRSKSEVGDIEIVCEPKMKIITDVFGELMLTDERAKAFISTVNEIGAILKGSPKDGRYVRIALNEGITLDLFIPESYDYYRIYALRTGSGEYSKRVLATGWRKIGWCGTPIGLRRIEDCAKPENPNSQWRCTNLTGELPPVWKSEQEFFDWIKVPWLEPQLRKV